MPAGADARAPDAPARYAVDDFAYDCPPELIAQYPAPDRADSRLLVLERASGTLAHRAFRDFPTLLHPGDVLVLNTSRVIPARLHGVRDNGRPAEVLLVHAEPDGSWLAMVHPGGKLKVGRRVVFGEAAGAADAAGVAEAEIVAVVGGGLRRVRFHGMEAREAMERFGTVPLPPYIHRAPEADDRERYQTVYARADGSVAAPTAGLHFTPEILTAVRDRGVAIAAVVLHVGPGTFKPVEVTDPAQHIMHAEWYEVSEATAATINAARAAGGRIWAVGTTAARVLETAAAPSPAPPASAPAIYAGSGWTDLFIYPPYVFRAVDALLTNFHLPRSTLLMLVAAFAGHTPVMAAYREAVRARYRLYSYGDAMAVV
ncbi:MAG: tRNA preQ1(34) S-adenosylmethionine ribosyltransferase-isomerase QueA [Gemmatimonadota bacterium]|nr:tRNA preQ1(34) S-adenosylmethionine ribosyltransferase-isomerase QueA [Gemmatimonadota bacterium]